MTDLDKLADAAGHMPTCSSRQRGDCTCGARDTARRVVEALREPSEGMRKKMYLGPVVSWKETIDHILKEPADV